MIDIKLDKNKITTFKGKKHKKVLFLEIAKKPYDIKSSFLKEFICINDEYYAFDYYDFKGDLQTGLGIIIFSVVLHFWAGGGLVTGPFWITGLIFLVGLSFIIKLLVIKEKKLIMDRLGGLFSYPNYWSNTPVIVNFKDAIFINAAQGKMGTPTLMAPYSNWSINGFVFIIVDVISQLSFYVWYMDKNRPLPPGDAFDPYRQKDFERRKAEGFPPPLYYSCGIPTPEATPEQQAEREQYWKDEEYYAPDIKRPKDSEIFNKRTHKSWNPCVFGKKEAVFANKWYEFTFANGKVVYMLTNEKGEGFLPPEDEKYEVASLTLKDTWF
ncbi:hypothetical protein C7448_10756 [Tenacibaculum gallaicum]|uniref:Uncharacterized protein n=1 Tax=Tenacibaculum gallaicum TaxID=561505 RepID=A0A3E0HJY9_9FLAO|nr:hypothetical protein [Tenacibaculum gallaicum]REH46496.1 hypothetical protein C7448_10756 [Tenacibaculum gallaicum]